jgi:hypothetical protein
MFRERIAKLDDAVSARKRLPEEVLVRNDNSSWVGMIPTFVGNSGAS